MRHNPTGSSSNHDRNVRAADALDLARKMKPGPERNAALKEAGRLRTAASMSGYLDSSNLKAPK
jgi:hypothetical protein